MLSVAVSFFSFGFFMKYLMQAFKENENTVSLIIFVV